MPVSSQVSKVIANGNGVATVFSFNPVVIYETANLKVYKTDTDGVVTLLTEGTGPTNYSVSVSSFPGTGSVTYPATGATRLQNGETITIARVLDYVQETLYRNQRSYFPEAIETSFDYLTMLTQQLLEASSRSVQVPLGDPTDPQDLIDQVVAAAALAQAAADVISGLNVVPATETQAGFSELADIAETRAASDNTRTLTAQKTSVLNRYGADLVAANSIARPSDANSGQVHNITGNTQINTLWAGDYTGQVLELRFTGTPILSTSGNLIPPTGANFQVIAGDMIRFRYDTSLTKWRAFSGMRADGTALATSSRSLTRRQTVYSGPVNNSGVSNFGGTPGSTTVTLATTLRMTAAGGFDANGQVDRVCSITNPSWAGLNTNGVMYMYVDIDAAGNGTTGVGTLAPTYRWGGADVVTNNQFTFNVQEMIGKLGNGATASQVYRVYVGEVTVAAGVVSTIRWYALNGRYHSAFTSTLPAAGTAIDDANALLGTDFVLGAVKLILRNLTTEAGYAVGDVVELISSNTASSGLGVLQLRRSINSVGFTAPSSAPYYLAHKTTGAGTALTPASWAYALSEDRGW